MMIYMILKYIYEYILSYDNMCVIQIYILFNIIKDRHTCYTSFLKLWRWNIFNSGDTSSSSTLIQKLLYLFIIFVFTFNRCIVMSTFCKFDKGPQVVYVKSFPFGFLTIFGGCHDRFAGSRRWSKHRSDHCLIESNILLKYSCKPFSIIFWISFLRIYIVLCSKVNPWYHQLSR